MYSNIVLAAGLIGLAQAQSYTPPGAQTFGSLYTPDVTNPVTRGQTFSVTWDPTGHTTDGSTVSLVLCKGGSGNCVNAPTAIVSGYPAAKAQYTWSVPCSLAPGVQSTDSGYGMLIIVDGTGQFQYSTQFSVLAGTTCESSGSNSTTKATSSSTTSTYKSSSSSTTPDASSSWLTWNQYNQTTVHTTSYVSTTHKPSAPATQTISNTVKVSTTKPAATASASPFLGGAAQIRGGAAALVVAAGAAFFAL